MRLESAWVTGSSKAGRSAAGRNSPIGAPNSLRRSLKALALQVSRMCAVADPRNRVVVLCYHSIHPTKSFASATPADFSCHLDWLTDNCDVVPLSQMRAMAACAQARERPVVALTFDDGYADNYEFAFPLLQSRRLPATFFVTAGLVEKDAAVLARLQTLRRSRYEDVRPLEWAQVKAMHAAGMEIGAHTYSHPNLAVLSLARARDELWRSKQIIQDRLGERVRSMAYPFGKPGRHYTRDIATLAEEIGYEYACAVLFRAVCPSDSRFGIPRLFVTRDAVAGLREKVLGAWDLIGKWQERCPLWLARLVSPEDFPE